MKFDLYGDSWFEFEPFIASMKKYAEFKSLKRENMKEIYTFKFEGISFVMVLHGSYKNKLPNALKEMFNHYSHPDIVILKESKLVFGIEDTETSNVGNSQWQRMERLNYFIENDIPFFYYTYQQSTDRSGKKVTVRYPSSLQSELFERANENGSKMGLIYRMDQAEDLEKNHDEAVHFFLKTLIKKEDLRPENKISRQFTQSIVKGISRREKDIKISDFDNLSKEMNIPWLAEARNYSPIVMSSVNNGAATFNKGRQKVGWIESESFNEILRNH